jgi:hypothetical protein
MKPGPVGVLKCEPCHEQHPKAKSKAEVLAKGQNKAETLTEKRVKTLVYEILDEAGLSRNECKKCGVPFFRRKPMQELCKECNKKAEEKKDAGGSK